jgi:hypothetical protein
MQSLNHKAQELSLKMNTEGLSPVQIRLIKSIHALMANVLASEEESEYFDASAELMKKTAELIKHASFATDNNTISYGVQAVEFAVDTLNESLDENKIQNLDN